MKTLKFTVLPLFIGAFAFAGDLLPTDAKIQFNCGPFMQNGLVLQGVGSTQIYYSHMLVPGHSDPYETFVYMTYDYKSADSQLLEDNQAPDTRVPNGNVTKHFAGDAPVASDTALSKVELTFDSSGQPVAAQVSIVALQLTKQMPNTERVNGRASCELVK